MRLIKQVTLDEILVVVKDMPKKKAQGVDGFPKLFTRYQEEVKGDLVNIVLHLFNTSEWISL